MACNLEDPQIFRTYNRVLNYNDDLSWMIIGYGKTRSTLALYSAGGGGVAEMSYRLPDEVVYGFIIFEGSRFLITHVSNKISGVQRARGMAHQKTISEFFNQHDVTVNTTKPSELSPAMLRDKTKHLAIKSIPMKAGTFGSRTSDYRSSMWSQQPVRSKEAVESNYSYRASTGSAMTPATTTAAASPHEDRMVPQFGKQDADSNTPPGEVPSTCKSFANASHSEENKKSDQEGMGDSDDNIPLEMAATTTATERSSSPPPPPSATAGEDSMLPVDSPIITAFADTVISTSTITPEPISVPPATENSKYSRPVSRHSSYMPVDKQHERELPAFRYSSVTRPRENSTATTITHDGTTTVVPASRKVRASVVSASLSPEVPDDATVLEQVNSNRKDAAALAESTGILGDKYFECLQGYVSLQEPSSSFWKRRYFVVAEETMFMYINECSRTPSDYMPFSRVTVSPRDAEDEVLMPHSIAVDFGEGEYYMYFDSASTLNAFETEINKVISK